MGPRSTSELPNFCTDASSARSRVSTRTEAPGVSDRIRSAAALPLSTFRTASTTSAPARAKVSALAKPRPVFAPVITIRRPARFAIPSVFQADTCTPGLLRSVITLRSTRRVHHG